MSRIKFTLPLLAAFALVLGFASVSARAADGGGKKVSISGTVVDDKGAAVADARVMLVKPRPEAGKGGGAVADEGAGKGKGKGKGGFARPEPLASATTDKDGKFTLTADKDIPDGTYSVVAFAREKGMGRASVEIKGNVATPDKVDLKLAPRGPGKGGKGGEGPK